MGAEEETLRRLRDRIGECNAVEHSLTYFGQGNGGDTGGKRPAVGNTLDSGRVKAAQYHILLFWRGNFDSIRDKVNKTTLFAEENGLCRKLFLIEVIFSVSEISNNLLRPDSIGSLITKLTKKELFLEAEKRKSVGRKQRRVAKKRDTASELRAKRVLRRNSIFGGLALEPYYVNPTPALMATIRMRRRGNV